MSMGLCFPIQRHLLDNVPVTVDPVWYGFFFKHFYITCIYYVKRSYLACKIHGPDRSGGAVG